MCGWTGAIVLQKILGQPVTRIYALRFHLLRRHPGTSNPQGVALQDVLFGRSLETVEPS